MILFIFMMGIQGILAVFVVETSIGGSYGDCIGASVSLSEDGSLALLGSPCINSNGGAAYVYSPSAGIWKLESTLIGSDNNGAASQGHAVALSSDGNTALVRGFTDASSLGAAWIFTKVGGIWSQQGNKLVGSDYTPGSATIRQGVSVSLSANGNTALIGGYGDNSNIGAAWVFVRNTTSGTWVQQGTKLVGSGYSGTSYQGAGVSLSASGDTAVSSGPVDNSGVGAAWIFARNSSGSWNQDGSKLTPAGGECTGNSATSISGDGLTVLLGGDCSYLGAAWVFVKAGGVWTQQGGTILPTDYYKLPQFGSGVALSYDGNTAFIGGSNDDYGAGAVWLFVRDESNDWAQVGSKFSGNNNFGTSVALSSDGNTALGATPGSYEGTVRIYVKYTTAPSIQPTTARPSRSPSRNPSHSPSKTPSTSRPSTMPSKLPTTSRPSRTPTHSPTTSRP